MSVVTRRRKVRVSGDSEEFSEDSHDDNEVNKGSQGDTDLNVSSEARESEYETLDETGECESESGDDTTAVDEKEEGDLSDSVIIEYEREEGDGQESAPPKEKKLDDDEDRRNPQYIPKRGTFYEHDDRTATEDIGTDIVEKEADRNKESEKKKVWKEHENKWSHDRYNEEDQAPKSRDELIAIYGYDIRNEDAAPRARRRRKYGRGPNKYTRNWEDEDAYGKSGGPVVRGGSAIRRGGRGGAHRPFGQHTGDSEEEFPPLNSGREERTESASENNTFSSKPRGSPRAAPRGRRVGSFTPKLLSTAADGKEEGGRNEVAPFHASNSAGSGTTAWRKDSIQSRPEPARPRESHNDSRQTGQAHVPTGNRREPERLEENGWKPRQERNHSQGPLPSEEPATGVSPKGGDTGWALGRRSDRHAATQPIAVESQTYTPSTSRVRGRGQRIAGPSRQTFEFKSSVGVRRSLSETRMSSHDQSNTTDGGPYIESQVVNRTTDDMVQDLGRMTISEPQTAHSREYPRRPNKNQQSYHQLPERRQVVVPPRMQDNAANKPKRYSSQRQRSLPETGASSTAPPASASVPVPVPVPASVPSLAPTPAHVSAHVSAHAPAHAAAPTYAQPHGYYPPAGYVQQPEELKALSVVGSGYVQPPPVYGEAPPPPQQQPPAVPPPAVATTPPLALLPPPLPQAQAYAAPPFSSPPTFIPPPVAGPAPRILPPGPATFMSTAPPGAPIISYVATPAPSQFAPPAYSHFPAYTAVGPAQPPPELYQPQGITYYSPEEQVMQRTIAQKRQSTAIPIVPPPEKGPRGRGRLREEPVISPGAVSAALDVAGGTRPAQQQLEDALVEVMPKNRTDEGTVMSSGCAEVTAKITVSAEVIDAINVTEIPESADDIEPTENIISTQASAVATSTITASSDSHNIAPNLANEQEIQA